MAAENGNRNGVPTNKVSPIPIAIIGMSCRFSGGATDPEKLWKLCAEGRSAWSKIPSSRFHQEGFYHPNGERVGTSNVAGGHFLDEDPSLFDASFFNLSAEAARSMDPQVRLQLESVYEAMESAGITIEKSAGSDTSVYAGAFFRDYHDSLMRDPELMPRYFMTGNGAAMSSNRISYFYDLRGPSITVDTGCSTTLTALHLACQSLCNRESNTSIISGANVILNPDMFVSMSSLGLLSPDGKSYSFDARANGYGRGEGVATVIIKRLDDALRDNDPIRCVIRATALNQDGKTATLTSPNQKAQEELIRSCYQAAGVDVGETAFLAAHGTGTRTGDGIEIAAAANVFGRERSSTKPLLIGSLKTNIGHTEAASGLASVIQTALALEKGLIPPNTNFEEPNEKLGQVSGTVKVPTVLEQWPHEYQVRRASVNNFGYGGTNAHIILESLTPQLSELVKTPGSNGINGHTIDSPLDSFVIRLSGKDENIVKSMATNLGDHLRSTRAENEGRLLEQLAYTLGNHRSLFSWTAVLRTQSLEGIIAASDGGQFKANRALEFSRLGFVFTGQGAQWHAMGRELIDSYPTFRSSLERADQYLKEFGSDWSIIEELSRDARSSRINEMTLSLPLCTAVQISLLRLLRSWGITPTAVTGHSSGEVAAAYAAGALGFKSAMAITFFRGELGSDCQNKLTGKGGMIAVGLGPKDAQERISLLRSGKVVIACINSQSSVTISGDIAAIDELESQLQADGVFARRVKVEAAYHSHHMQAIAKEYLASLEEIVTPGNNFGNVAYSSPTTGKRETDVGLIGSAQHWVNNMLNPVRFAESFQNMCFTYAESSQSSEPTQEVDIVVELGPHGALKGPIQQMMALPIFEKSRIPYFPCLMRGQDAVHTMQDLASNLMSRGYRVDIGAVNFPYGTHGLQKLHDLPAYPWNHENAHWQEPRINRVHRQRIHPPHDLLGSLVLGINLSEPVWRHFIRVQDIPWVRDHTVQSNIVYPGAGFICMAVEAIAQLNVLKNGQSKTAVGYRLAEIDILRALVIPDTADGAEVRISLRPSSGKFMKTKEWHEFSISSVGDDDKFIEHCRGSIAIEPDSSSLQDTQATLLSSHFQSDALMSSVHPDELYSFLRSLGVYHGPTFQNLSSIRTGKNYSESCFVVADTASTMPCGFQSQHIVHPTTLDSIFQGAYTTLPGAGLEQNVAMIPRSIQELYLSCDFSALKGHHFRSKSFLVRHDVQSFKVNICISDATRRDEKPNLMIKGMRYQSVGQMASQKADDNRNDICFRSEWAPDISSVKEDRLKKRFGFPLDPSEVDLLVDLRQACLYFIRQTLQSLTASDLAQLENHQKKFYDWMIFQTRLAKADRLAPNSSKWLECSAIVEQKLLESVRSSSVNGEMIYHVGKNMIQILRHEIAPLELMLQEKLLYRYYTDAIKWDRSYEQIGNLVKLYAHKYSSAKIIEVGGGTGGCTKAVLDALSSYGSTRCAQYDFTDVSSGFFEAAREKFASFGDIMRYQKLDIETDPGEQDFECGTYDLVVASQVLHATATMRHTMTNVRRLLKPGGKLLLVETTRDEMDLQLVFGLLPGWWLSSEDDRKMSPSMDISSWDGILKQTGFGGLDLELHDCESESYYSFSVMMATAAMPETTLPPTEMAIIYDGSPIPSQWLSDMKRAVSALTRSEPVAGTLGKVDPAGKICLFVGEMNKAILPIPSEEEFSSIKDMATRCKGLIWVTRGGAIEYMRPQSSLPAGLLRTLRNEYTEKRFVSLDLDPLQPLWTGKSITTICGVVRETLIGNMGTPFKDSEFAERDGELHVPRIYKDIARNRGFVINSKAPPQLEPFLQPGKQLKLEIGTPGLLDTLKFSKTDATADLPVDFVEIEPRAFGLNFRDIMVAMGQLEESVMGFECSGIVRRVGSVNAGHNLKVGDRVCALLRGHWTNSVRVHWHCVAQIPDDMDYETAASIPMAFVTSYISLVDIAKLRATDTVLIHAASGGVGQAALILAKHIGAEVFVTVGTEDKRNLLINEYDIQPNHIFSSRNASFVEGIQRKTKGRGVDVVLNSLAGGLLQESFDSLAEFGRFVEIGKRDIELRHCLDMGTFSRGTSFSAVDLIAIGNNRSSSVFKAMSEVLSLLKSKEITPVKPISTYKMSEMENVFRLMQAGKHMGKIVISVTPDVMVPVIALRKQLSLRSDSSYMIVGGLGGIGRSLCKNFVEHGAKSLIILSRNASGTKGNQQFLNKLRRAGCAATVFGCDVSDETQVKVLMKRCKAELPPIRGVIHAGMILQDSIFEHMTIGDYDAAIRPKVQGSWNLHTHLADHDLDFFIMLSSLAGVSGSASQANYTAGGTFQDALAKHRRERHLPAVSIDLGMVNSVGYVAETKGVAERLTRMGYRAISEAEVLKIVESAILDPPSDTAAQIITGIGTWQGPHWDEASWLQDARFSTLREHVSSSGRRGTKQNDLVDGQPKPSQLLSNASSFNEAVDVVEKAVTKKVANMFLIAEEDIVATKSLGEYGVDSLVAVELRNWLAAQLSSDVSVFDVMQTPSLTALSSIVVRKSTLVEQSLLIRKGQQ